MLIEHESNVVGSSGLKQTSSFKIASSAHAFRILSSGLYSDKISAVLREIGCNAMDAHIAAGKPDLPFEVHLPSRLTSKFFIRDFGPGMSPDEILALYTTYFSSSKQQSNEFTGAFGLGSKSPFSYTDSFTIVSVNGGKKYTYSAYVDQVGGPSVSLVSEEPAPADWESGMMISLPVKQHDVNEFYQKAQHIFSWFRVLPRMVNSQPINPREYSVQTSEFAIPKNPIDYTQIGVVMGNVRYPVPWEECRDDRYQWAHQLRPILRLAIGAVDVAASREQLEFTPKTRAAIKKAMDKATEHVGKELADYTKQFDLTTIAGMREAQKWLYVHASKWGNSTFKWLLQMGGLDDARLDELAGFMGSSPYLRVPDDVKCKMWTYHTDGRGRLRVDTRDWTQPLLSTRYLPGDLRHNSAVLLPGKTKYLKDRLRHELRSNKFDYLSVIQDVDDTQAAEIAKKLYDYPVVKAEDLGLPSDWIPPSQRPKKPRKPAGADATVKMALIDRATGEFDVDASYALEDVVDDQKFFVRPACAWGKYKFYFGPHTYWHSYDQPLGYLARIAQHVPEIPSGIGIVKVSDVKRFHLEDKHGWKFVGTLADILLAQDVRDKVNDVQAKHLSSILSNGFCGNYESPLLFIASHAKASSPFWQALKTRLPSSHMIKDAARVALGAYTVSTAKPIPLDAYNNALVVFGQRSQQIKVVEKGDGSVTLYPSFYECLDCDFPNNLIIKDPELAADLVARLIEADETHLPSTIDLLAA